MNVQNSINVPVGLAWDKEWRVVTVFITLQLYKLYIIIYISRNLWKYRYFKLDNFSELLILTIYFNYAFKK